MTSKTLPAPVTPTKEAVVEANPPEVQPEAATPAPVEVQPEVATPAAVEPPSQVNEVPKIEVKKEEAAALPKPGRPLSPYPYVSSLLLNN